MDTPKSERIHIGIFGRCNSGKSSLLNALTGSRVALVSDVAGTTTDPVVTNMEFPGLGAVTFIDTAGFDDHGELGEARRAATRRAAERVDIALIVYSEVGTKLESEWIELFGKRGIPTVAVFNKCDLASDLASIVASTELPIGLKLVVASAKTGEGIDQLIDAITEAGRQATSDVSITEGLVHEGDVVMLVMPQDAQAPKGRLILPQVQTLRELLDKGCTAICCTPDRMTATLRTLVAPPALVVTDSQVFGLVAAQTPVQSLLTSFSVLFANYKGDLRSFIEGATAIDRLSDSSRVLIAEACTHAPASEDIGRIKIPRMLRSRVGEGLHIDVVGGSDFPSDLTPYDLIIHCGACMFNRRHVLSRIAQAKAQGVCITNYGIAIAHLQGILSRVALPGVGQI